MALRRAELSPYMNGETVRIQAEVLCKRTPYFDGRKGADFLNPETGLSAAMLFYEGSFVPQELSGEQITLVRPLSINAFPIKESDHMWVLYDIDVPGGAIVELFGHIIAYRKRGTDFDYGIQVYRWRHIETIG